MTTFTATVRLTEPAVGGDTGTWGGELNSDLVYIDEALNQSVTVNIADTNVTLVHDGSSSDQARYLRYNFTGALTADRTVTLPANQKVGWASNNTTGGHNLTLTTGAGSTLTLTTTGWTLFQCDGSNVTAVPVDLGGTTTNDNAETGRIGEYVSSNVAAASAVSLANNVAKNVTSISLTAGDWDVSGNVVFTMTGSCDNVQSWVSTTSATRPTPPNAGAFCEIPGPSTVDSTALPTGTIRISVNGTTTVYLSTIVLIVSGTVKAYGFIGARRAR